MRDWFQDTVSALAYSFGEDRQNAPGLQPPYNDVAQFILRQHRDLAAYLRAPLMAAIIGFDCQGFLTGGQRFHKLKPEARARQIATWKNSSLSFKRDLIRYFESLAVMQLYSRQDPPTTSQNPSADFSPQVITSPPPESRHQIIVIGSGPGGAITACLLAEAGRDVLLLEEGNYLSLDSCAPFSKDELVQKYRNGGQTVAMGKDKIAYVEGRCVGGGSEINSGLYHRTPPEILDAWQREFQVQDISEDALQPQFEACEQDLSVSLLPGAAPAASLKLHDGATKLGWKSLEVPRWFRYSGQQNAGRRQSMTETFIPRFLRAGGKILPRARAGTLHQAGGVWLLQAEHATAGPIRLTAETVFVCGGAVQTPALLRRSGIHRNIGNSLRLHPTVKVVAKFPEPVNTVSMGVPVHQVKEFAPRVTFGCAISNLPYLALALRDHADQTRDLAQAWPQMASYYAMITGEGRGSIRALPRIRDPLVRYHLTPNDRRDLADGLQKLSLALFESGAGSLYPGISRSPALRNRDDLGKLPYILPSGMADLITIHLFSSCPMGEDQSKCATDSFGRLHGLKNLYVNDASLLCTAPGVNPQGSIMAIARRNVGHFLDHSTSRSLH
jgi:choline dehydrogenase-like flavoprotein